VSDLMMLLCLNSKQRIGYGYCEIVC